MWSGAIQTLEKQLQATCAYVLLLSHYTRALESWKNKVRGVAHQVEQQISLVECKVAGSIPERAVCFSGIQSREKKSFNTMSLF